jgi:hypothetical protein
MTRFSPSSFLLKYPPGVRGWKTPAPTEAKGDVR